MKRLIGGFVIVGLLDWGVLQLHGHEEPGAQKEPGKKTVREVMQEHEKEWRATPDVQGISPGDNDIWIITDRPELFPSEIDGVPIITKAPPQRLPPPPGLHIAHEDGTWEYRADLEQCPEGYVTQWEYRWLLCNLDDHRQPTPSDLMMPPVGGVPFQQAVEIWEKRQKEILQLPGVTGAGLGANGIRVITDHPELLPGHLEGVPVFSEKPIPNSWVEGNNHTSTTAIRPLIGGVAMEDNSVGSNLFEFFTGNVVMSEGKPWVMVPNHGIQRCEFAPECSGLTYPLNGCPHYQQTANTPRIDQPTDANALRVSWLTRWFQLAAGGTGSIDSAAGFMDSNTTEGDASLVTTRSLYQYSGTFTGVTGNTLSVGDIVNIPTAVDYWKMTLRELNITSAINCGRRLQKSSQADLSVWGILG